MFVVPALVVRDDIAGALQDLGISNIEYYPCTLHHRSSGMKWENYFVANVIGVVDPFDKKKSKISKLSVPGHNLYDKMVFDNLKCQHLHIFRIAGRLTKVAVSEEIKDKIEALQLKYIHFVKPEDFA